MRMEITQSGLSDVLAQPGGCRFLPPDLDPDRLVELLSDRYGAPRTLVLDGRADPTEDEFAGGPLLALLAGRGLTIRAWAYGDQWIGASTARARRALPGQYSRPRPAALQSRRQELPRSNGSRHHRLDTAPAPPGQRLGSDRDPAGHPTSR